MNKGNTVCCMGNFIKKAFVGRIIFNVLFYYFVLLRTLVMFLF